MTPRHYDAIVIGTAPGGEGADPMLGMCGREVAVVGKSRDVGGGCTHWVTIPSKAPRDSCQRIGEMRADPLLHRVVGPVYAGYPGLLERARSVVIRGAGVIGCDYASIFVNLGLNVDLASTRDQRLATLDDEITDALGYHPRNLGVVIRHAEEHQRVEAGEDAAVLHTKSGKKFSADVLP